jgi:hypothetical protein
MKVLEQKNKGEQRESKGDTHPESRGDTHPAVRVRSFVRSSCFPSTYAAGIGKEL